MKKSPIKKISPKRQKTLRDEAKVVSEMLEQCEGRCMICGQKPFSGLEKNHTKDRKRFILSCRSCHAPGGAHKYLEDKG